MEFRTSCLINILLAFIALILYVIGSYKFYKNQKGYHLLIGIALLTDGITAFLASFKITPTVQIPHTTAVPWDSVLFKCHVVFSTIGIIGFLILFVYLSVRRNSNYNTGIRKWQFIFLLPVWVFGELIALLNASFKIFFGIRLFDLL